MAAPQPLSFDDVLEKIHEESKSTAELGTRFERIIKKYFETDALRTSEFKKAWLWREDACPGKDVIEQMFGTGTRRDHGIDLVAQKTDGSLCAIQCKCYARDAKLAENDVSNFLALASAGSRDGRIFGSMIFVWTGREITGGAAALLEGHSCEVLDHHKLKKSAVDWGSLLGGRPKNLARYKLRPHQKRAVDRVVSGFNDHDRGKLVMACGTGKTFVTLKVAERQAGMGGVVLYLVPSISLLQQSMREWAEQAGMPHRYLAVCSDTKVGRDDEDASLSELEISPTTDPTKISSVLSASGDHMLVVFSTYQSIMRVSDAQKKCGIVFDMVICDEAHRTTGVIQHDQAMRSTTRISDSDEGTISSFVAVHSQDNVRAKKRLYATATPKIYAPASRKRVEEGYGVETYSMDDEDTYGPDLYRLTFDEAISQNLLSDYKVVVMTVREDDVARITQRAADNGDALDMPTVAKLIGCWKGLKNPDQKNPRPRGFPLQRAIAFTQSIRNSKRFAHSFPKIVGGLSDNGGATCVSDHVDGSQNALNRREKLNWLEESNVANNECRVLSNARCLSEGVDVPALDAVIFLNPRGSIIDVIQAVGRVMRKAEGKKYGYVLLPVAIPAGSDSNAILNDHKTYKVVWNVLNALRAHDSQRFEKRFIDGDIMSDIIVWNRVESCPDCLAGICDRHAPRPQCRQCEQEFKGGARCLKHSPDLEVDIPAHLIHAKIVEKISDRRYLESWAEDVSKIVARVTSRIMVLRETNPKIRAQFDEFYKGLRKMINEALTEDDAIDMLAQHMVTGRVFDALFQGNDFTKNNPVAKTMDAVLKSLMSLGLAAEMEDLEKFYIDMEERVRGIKDHKGRQRVIRDLYDKFFNRAFKRTAERLGIVYTPIEVVDFILRSADYLLRERFGTDLSDRNVNVIDPFVGTGSFLARLMSKDLGLIKDEDLIHKYKNSLHASEIVLLAYYISAINCESTFAERSTRYLPFGGAALVDTFHKKDLTDEWKEGLFTEAQSRIERQRKAQITVIVTNPPYSKGQKNFSNNNPNVRYVELEKRIQETYFKRTKTHDKKSLYDSYIQSIRWASDRIGDSGIIAVITNAGFLRSDTNAGLRASLAEEFDEIYCFDLRGNAMISGEPRKKEGDGVFGEGSRISTAITILVKNTTMSRRIIRYYDIGDYLNRDQKLEIIQSMRSVEGIKNWQIIEPDKHHDWLNQRGDDFAKHVPLGDKDVKRGQVGLAIFGTYSLGVATHRDVWIYNSSTDTLAKNMITHIKYSNSLDPNRPIHNTKKAKIDSTLLSHLKKSKVGYNPNAIRIALYRPFFKQHMYFDKVYNSALYQIPKLFPHRDTKNLVICVPYKFTGSFSTFVTDITPDLHVIEANQCFPFYVYEKDHKQTNITDHALAEYRTHYGNKSITAKQIFYYVYGMLHHPGYREKFKNNLIRELPRIPMAPDFGEFCRLGKELVDLHLGYETCKRHDLGEPKCKTAGCETLSFGRKTAKQGDGRSTVTDHRVIRANGVVLFDNVPDTSYRVKDRTPVEWIVDRYRKKTDKASEITNDPCADTDIVAVIERARSMSD